MNMEESPVYIGEAYLNRVKLALIGLDYLDGDMKAESAELLSIEPFNRPLYELLYAAIVTGVEDYLRTRLKHDVLKSEERMRLYLHRYNYYYRKKRERQIQFSKDEPLTPDIQERLLETLDNHVYHRIDIINGYFEAVASVKLPEDDLWQKLFAIIQTRHIIIHEGGKRPNGKRIELTPYDVHQALNVAEHFVLQAERLFYQKGNEYLYDIPGEE